MVSHFEKYRHGDVRRRDVHNVTFLFEHAVIWNSLTVLTQCKLHEAAWNKSLNIKVETDTGRLNSWHLLCFFKGRGIDSQLIESLVIVKKTEVVIFISDGPESELEFEDSLRNSTIGS